MKTYNGFIISVFAIFLTAPFSLKAQSSKECQKMDVTVTVEQASKGAVATIRIECSGKDAQLTYHLFGVGDASKNDKTKLKEGTIKNVLPGTYDIVVVDASKKYCSETRNLTVN